MGKSRVVKVMVSMKSSDLRITLSRVDGLPGSIKISGVLYDASLTKVITGARIELWIDGLHKASTTTSFLGMYAFNYTFGDKTYDVYTHFPGNDTYFADSSPLVRPTFAKVGTNITIDVNPLFGAPPLAVTITGRLSRDDTTGGLGARVVELHRNGVKIKTATTKTSTPLGIYQFNDTLSAGGGYEYYVYFAGDALFEGCEASDGTTVSDGEPPDDEEPPTPPPTGIGAGAVLLALLVLSQE